MYGSGFGPGVASPDRFQQTVGARGGGNVDGVTAAAVVQPSAGQLPALEAVAPWFSMLVEKDGERAVIQALLATVPGDRVMAIIQELCQQRFGDDLGCQVRPDAACHAYASPCSLPRVLTEAHPVLPTLSSAKVRDEKDTATSAPREVQ